MDTFFSPLHLDPYMGHNKNYVFKKQMKTQFDLCITYKQCVSVRLTPN